jgi:hypothetical protein
LGTFGRKGELKKTKRSETPTARKEIGERRKEEI